MDENCIPYDISGVNESETDDYIPEYMMGDTILDFKHIAGRVHNTSDQEIAKMVLDWHDIKSDQFGGDVTKIKMKRDGHYVGVTCATELARFGNAIMVCQETEWFRNIIKRWEFWEDGELEEDIIKTTEKIEKKEGKKLYE